MARLITLNAEKLGEVIPQLRPNYCGERSVAVRLSMNDGQREEAIRELVGLCTTDQWCALRDHLDKEFAT